MPGVYKLPVLLWMLFALPTSAQSPFLDRSVPNSERLDQLNRVVSSCNPAVTISSSPPLYLKAKHLQPLQSPFLAPEIGPGPFGLRPVTPLAAGTRPITVLVALAQKDLVARTVVSWGYVDSTNQFVQGGVEVFDHQGGVAFGSIPPGVDLGSVRVSAAVDYVQHELTDLEYALTPDVDASGVLVVLQTSSNLISQRLILRSVGTVRENDYLVLRFQSNPDSANAASRQRGSTLILADELKHAVHSILDKQLTIPVRPEDGQAIHWTIHGRLQGQQVEKSFTVKDRNAFEVFVNSNGRLDVWLGPGQ